MANILDVVQTIQNIVSTKGYDGALDEEGKPVKMGLNREVDSISRLRGLRSPSSKRARQTSWFKKCPTFEHGTKLPQFIISEDWEQIKMPQQCPRHKDLRKISRIG